MRTYAKAQAIQFDQIQQERDSIKAKRNPKPNPQNTVYTKLKEQGKLEKVFDNLKLKKRFVTYKEWQAAKLLKA